LVNEQNPDFLRMVEQGMYMDDL